MSRTSILSVLAAVSLIGVMAPATLSHADGKDELSVRPPRVAPTKPSTDTVILTFARDQARPAEAARDAVTEAADSVAGAEVSSVTPITDDTVAVTLDITLSAAQQDELDSRVTDVPGVETTEPSVKLRATKTNDTYYSMLWGLKSGSAYGVGAESAWSATTGKGAVVGVVDTGITAHRDLTGSKTKIVGGNVVAGYDFITDPATAGDKGGRDSNPTDEGDYCISEGEPSSWHGTQVTGVITAIRNNKRGVVGVAPGVKVQPLRVLGNCGGESADLIAAMRWGAGLPVSGISTKNKTPVDVLNLSLGGEAPCTPAMQQAIDDVVAAGVPVVVAAGNEEMPLAKSTPANCDNVIAVTATTYQGKLARYTNFGTADKAATIAGPGGNGLKDTYTDWIVSTGNAGLKRRGSETYYGTAGTSMSAPHVAAVAALLKSINPSLTPAKLTERMTTTAKSLPSPCTAEKCGAGLVNAAAAVKAEVNALLAATSVKVSGTAAVGKKLTAKVTRTSTKSKLSYQWLRNGKKISKATKSTYTATSSDVGKTVSVKLKVAFGSTSRTLTASAGVVVKGEFVNTKRPYTSGTFKVGKTVKAKVGTWSPKPSKYSYRWYRDDVKISKATKSKYKLKKADRGHVVSVRVTVTRSGYVTASERSSAKLVK